MKQAAAKSDPARHSLRCRIDGNRDRRASACLCAESSGRDCLLLEREQAILRFMHCKSSGMRLIDIGCMQLNYFYHGDRFSSIEHMFDPHLNVDYAARYLKDLKHNRGKLDYRRRPLQRRQE